MTDSSLSPLRSLVLADDAERLTIALPAPRYYLRIFLLVLGLAGWAIVFVSTLAALFGNLSGGMVTVIFLLGWLLGWLLVGAVVLAGVLWMSIGREIVTLGNDTLTIRREILGRGLNQAFKMRHIEDLRVTSDPFNLYQFVTSLRPLGIGGGKLLFDYLNLTIQFGAGITIDEAQPICARLRQRLEQKRGAASPS